MALTAILHSFDVALSDVDRGVYEQLALKVARHPSESEEYLLTRLLAPRQLRRLPSSSCARVPG